MQPPLGHRMCYWILPIFPITMIYDTSTFSEIPYKSVCASPITGPARANFVRSAGPAFHLCGEGAQRLETWKGCDETAGEPVGRNTPSEGRLARRLALPTVLWGLPPV